MTSDEKYYIFIQDLDELWNHKPICILWYKEEINNPDHYYILFTTRNYYN